MLATGIRMPLGLKVMGPKIEGIKKLGIDVETRLKDIRGTRSVYAERIATGGWIDNGISQVGDNGDNGDLFSPRAIVPENAISRGRPLLDIGFKNLLSPWPFKRGKLVGIQGRMPQVRFHEPERFSYRFQNIFLGWIIFDFLEV